MQRVAQIEQKCLLTRFAFEKCCSFVGIVCACHFYFADCFGLWRMGDKDSTRWLDRFLAPLAQPDETKRSAMLNATCQLLADTEKSESVARPRSKNVPTIPSNGPMRLESKREQDLATLTLPPPFAHGIMRHVPFLGVRLRRTEPAKPSWSQPLSSL